jgi:4-hydroxy-2-oxoheptanedioate aldolase
MRTNTVKQKLADGKPVFGVMLTFPAAPVVEMLGYMGFDWILLDNEHGSITVDTAEDVIRAAELTGIAPIVRPVANRPEMIAPFLDRGAWGVQVPHVNTRREAEAAVAACKYFPDGERGSFSRGRPAQYGMSGPTSEYFAKANAETLVCLMLEETVAVDNIAEIVKVKGVDVLFIGSGDLSQSMGFPGQQSRPEVLKVMEKGVKVIRDAGVAAGVSCPDALIPKFLDLGVQYFHSNVGSLLQSAGQADLKTVRQAAGSNK